MERNKVILVDVNDNSLGYADKMQAHEAGLLHRAFSIFIMRKFHDKTEILLQQRALTKYHCAGLWSNTCCSHPQPNDNLQHSALKRLEEELGFKLNSITWVDSHIYQAQLENSLIEHEFDHLFVNLLTQSESDNLEVRPNPVEVNNIKWLSINEIEQALKSHPEQFTPWFEATFFKVINKLSLTR
ncbi:isopentenyl-diphosphate Delta-isomerase [Pseudoalteromonas denitrificans]|uniref:Isopentenyl-diphosphate Delta-isomerase n=1 Tax=Pseudoalteromonas denitrificans DSM 6059 TaxID=1123010 RepID=A0A1I1FNL7_9GAMM|nr:isopentenyl-diphosphate Delta-isomerase [Pseudoalteromonas denitrificans]SFC00881.1 isopentenyl-diphosphate delta-isomerase [Pseudoalteromonas denitrificans DSM 6059]